jgi:predicted nucleic acid-binding protein
MRTYIDSDVLIWYLRGELQARRFFRKISKNRDLDLWIGALQRAEIVCFMRPHEETLTLEFLSRFKTADVSQRIVDAGALLYRKWGKSHGTDVNDAMLAATVVGSHGHLFTLNAKHFPMPELTVTKAWT